MWDISDILSCQNISQYHQKWGEANCLSFHEHRKQIVKTSGGIWDSTWQKRCFYKDNTQLKSNSAETHLQ